MKKLILCIFVICACKKEPQQPPDTTKIKKDLEELERKTQELEKRIQKKKNEKSSSLIRPYKNLG